MRLRTLWLVLLVTGVLAGCASSSKTFLYVLGPGTNEVFQFQIGSNGSLTALDPATVTTGSNPLSLAFRPPGDFAYIANSAGNDVTLLAVNTGNGQLSIPVNNNPIATPTPPNIFATGTTPAVVVAHPASPFLYILNAGSSDINGYVIDPTTGNLTGNTPVCAVAGSAAPCPVANTQPLAFAPGMAIAANGSALFVGNTALSSISVFSIDSKGILTSAGSPVSVGTAPAGMAVEASGRFLYAADPANNRVLGFSIQSNGGLAAISGSPFAAGAGPVALATDPQGALLFAANSNSNDVSAYVIDKNSGALGPIGGSPFATGGRGPSFLTATGSFLFVAEQTTNDVAVFSIGSNGALAPVPSSPFNVATSPLSMAIGR